MLAHAHSSLNVPIMALCGACKQLDMSQAACVLAVVWCISPHCRRARLLAARPLSGARLPVAPSTRQRTPSPQIHAAPLLEGPMDMPLHCAHPRLTLTTPRPAPAQVTPLLEGPVGMALYEYKDGQLGNICVQGGGAGGGEGASAVWEGECTGVGSAGKRGGGGHAARCALPLPAACILALPASPSRLTTTPCMHGPSQTWTAPWAQALLGQCGRSPLPIA